LQQAFSASGAALGGLAATYFYVYTLMQIPTGVLADTLGPRRIVALGGVIAGIGSLLFGLADTLAAASAGRLLVGLGVSVTFISLLVTTQLPGTPRAFNEAWTNFPTLKS
jgi:MFS family permease